MAEISDLLGIDHFTTARGATVRRDFLEAVARALGVPEVTINETAKKDGMLDLVIQTATGAPTDPNLYSRGATVTNDALQTILDGLRRRGAGSHRPHR